MKQQPESALAGFVRLHFHERFHPINRRRQDVTGARPEPEMANSIKRGFASVDDN
jgi:hypothetical protein